MKRRLATERVARFTRKDYPKFEQLACKAARWTHDHLDGLRQAEPNVQETLDDRATDNWRPLFAIAGAAGGHWAERAREAAEVVSAPRARNQESAGLKLLADIRSLF